MYPHVLIKAVRMCIFLKQEGYHPPLKQGFTVNVRVCTVILLRAVSIIP